MRVVVIGTGGTIASRSDDSAGAIAAVPVSHLLKKDFGGDSEVEFLDLFSIGSYAMTLEHLRIIAETVDQQCGRSDVDGVVVTHGTDTLEESAYLVSLTCGSEKPVVFTGAQRASDAPDTDGPRNLADAIAVAGSRAARGCGALVVFAGHVYAADRTRKSHTLDAMAFATSDGGPIGVVRDGEVRMTSRPVRREALPLPPRGFDTTRVEVVALYPGVDASLLEAAIAAGADAVVLAGMGAGNGNPKVLEWVLAARSNKFPVLLSTRVPFGAATAIYGNGGGVSLVNAGAVLLGPIPVYHGRILATLLLSLGRELTEVNIESYY